QTSAERLTSGLDASDEVLANVFESLGEIDLGSDHVTRAMPDEDLVFLLLAFDLHPFVVDLNRIVAIQVIVDHHLAAPANQRTTDLDGREPVDVEVGKRIVRKLNRHIR